MAQVNLQRQKGSRASSRAENRLEAQSISSKLAGTMNERPRRRAAMHAGNELKATLMLEAENQNLV